MARVWKHKKKTGKKSIWEKAIGLIPKHKKSKSLYKW
jgi:hypothetical protein